MTKSCWLICIAFLSCIACFAQSPVGNTTSPFKEISVSIRSGNSLRIQWETEYISNAEYFIVERSSDELHYETVSVLKITDTLGHYELVNASPQGGNFFYRIKWMDKSGNYVYSQVVPVRISSDFEFKFYPNPADKLLIVRTAHPIEVEVLDAFGAIRLTKELASGIQVLNVASLEKGNYILRVADKESNRIISSQLLKN
jgi:type IX secretion system substrate protein